MNNNPLSKWHAAIKYHPIVTRLANLYYRLGNRKLESVIFVATTGRSGTLTLVDIFSQIPDCLAVHEPYPVMNGSILHDANYGRKDTVTRFYKERKSVNIRRAASGARYYLEANHLFIKTFVEQTSQDFGDRLRIIHLVRNPMAVASSIYCLHDEPGTEAGNRWWLDYRAPSNLINIAELLENSPRFSNPYFKCLWYWFELEARTAYWKKHLPQTPVVTFYTEDFSSATELKRLFSELGIVVKGIDPESLTQLHSHQRSHQKQRQPLPADLQLEMLNTFITEMTGRSYALPESLSRYVEL
ncbi:sulfotransferase domain-containing protein [Parahaliea sp. F7430]|uniref:Sulfotransferase domain-containing protein n=1 Tax=Sediminihaliea albiluteola TaxID=2758564 RepID=A0A7W2YJ18_9GAMM|nr:sulfotransferase domain-containing protein [Sediminihaliea albiluteola]MBA6412685.1 sulfotransferase domain-containing protein [Sediminihaliea albiluteola]